MAHAERNWQLQNPVLAGEGAGDSGNVAQEGRRTAVVKELVDGDYGLTTIVTILNAEQVALLQGDRWTKSLVYNLKVRRGWHRGKPVNVRSHTDAEVKLRMRELRDRGTPYQSIANILNEEGYLPYKGKEFTLSGVCQLALKDRKFMTPREFCESVIRRAEAGIP